MISILVYFMNDTVLQVAVDCTYAHDYQIIPSAPHPSPSPPKCPYNSSINKVYFICNKG